MTVFTWSAGDGTSTADWTGPANWDQGASYPQAGDTAIFPSGKHKCYVNAASTCYDVQIQGDEGDTILELQANLEVTHDLLITSGIMNLGAGSYTLTVGGDLTLNPVGAGTSTDATLICGNADISAAKLETSGEWHSGGYTPKAVFTGGTGDHTFGIVYFLVGTDVVLSSGVTEITGTYFRTDVNTTYNTYDNGDGTVKFTSASDQLLYSTSQAADAYNTFYNLILEKTTSTLQGLTTVGFHIKVENNLTITSGILNTNTTDATNHNLTVSNNTTVENGGTLTANNSTLIFGTNGVHGDREQGVLWAKTGGSVTFGTGDVTIYGGFKAEDSNTLTSSGGGDLYIAGRSGNGFLCNHTCTGVNITGDIKITFDANSLFDCRGNPTFTCNRMSIDVNRRVETWSNSADQTLTVNGDLYITTGSFEQNQEGGQDVDVTITQNVVVEDGGTWGATGGGSASAVIGSLSLSGTSIFNASTSNTTLSGSGYAINAEGFTWPPMYQRAGATFNHNNGTFVNKNTQGYIGYHQHGGTIGPYYNYVLNFNSSAHTQNTHMTIQGDCTMSGTATSNGGVIGLRNESAYFFRVSGNLTLLDNSGIGGNLYGNGTTQRMITKGNIIINSNATLHTATGSTSGWEVGGNLINNGGYII